MMNLMTSFPPLPEEQVTLANWRTAPFSSWAFHHVRELVASADIPNAPTSVWQLEEDYHDFSDLVFEGKSLIDFCEATDTNGLVILHKGKLIYETYANGMNAFTPHILMSVSKSVLGLLGGILEAKGVLDTASLLTKYLPELENTAWQGATVRQALDMQVGIRFDEDYLAKSGPIIDYRKAMNWNPLDPGDQAGDLRSFFLTLMEKEGVHGDRFHYVSPNTDLLAWVYERAAERRYADLLSDLLWKPMGAERSAYITVDGLGAPRAAGGLCVTTRDLARLGQLLVQDGKRDGNQIIPSLWIKDILEGGNSQAWSQGDFADYFPGYDMHYRAQCYVMRGDEPLIFGSGIHGQNVFVDPNNDIVIAKHSSQSLPVDHEVKKRVVNVVSLIRDYLKG